MAWLRSRFTDSTGWRQLAVSLHAAGRVYGLVRIGFHVELSQTKRHCSAAKSSKAKREARRPHGLVVRKSPSSRTIRVPSAMDEATACRASVKKRSRGRWIRTPCVALVSAPVLRPRHERRGQRPDVTENVAEDLEVADPFVGRSRTGALGRPGWTMGGRDLQAGVGVDQDVGRAARRRGQMGWSVISAGIGASVLTFSAERLFRRCTGPRSTPGTCSGPMGSGRLARQNRPASRCRGRASPRQDQAQDVACAP